MRDKNKLLESASKKKNISEFTPDPQEQYKNKGE